MVVDEKAIFVAAVQLADANEREAYLQEACASDLDALNRLKELLSAHEESQGPLDRRPPALGVTVDIPLNEGPGTVIGPYKLLEQIGEGGFGVVFMAEQTQPVRRKVALKILKPGMDTRQIVARFEAERQALALMDHPNIAKVLDAGTTPPSPPYEGGVRGGGRPYFVMELVKGVPITEFCDNNHLTPRQRLELFVPVCQAIQHAHQKGIIHRDLKPSNILVTMHDTTPVPKVIDFGIAKALGQELTDKTLFTGFAQMIGTPLYMSPEQAGQSGLDIDTRSDIYALGVLLYELLTGTTPFTKERFKQAGYEEIRRIIREEEPPKPSTRLAQSTETMPSISAQRHMEPAKLTKLVRGELDWIVMKALEKDRNRRYETANGFAQDVQRYLADEPVLACPPSAGYRLRKFARRHRGPVLAVAVALLLLMGGIIGTSWGLVQADKARWAETKRAEAEANERKRAETAEQQAKANEKRAEEEKMIAQAVSDFLLNDLLYQAAPIMNARRKKVTVEELLKRAASRIAGRFADQPRTEVAIRLIIGNTFRELGDFAAALPHLERALQISRANPSGHEDLNDSLNSLATLYHVQGNLPKAEPLYVEGLELCRRFGGEDYLGTLKAINGLAALYQDQGRLTKAEPLFAQVLDGCRRTLGEEDHFTLRAMNNLASLYHSQGQLAKAEPLLVEVLDVYRRRVGDDNPDAMACMNNLASLYKAWGQFAKAEPLYVKSLAVSGRVLGEDHPDTLTVMINVAVFYDEQGQFAKAEPLWRKALQITRTRQAKGDASPVADDVLTSALGANLLKQQKFADAESILRECLAAMEKKDASGWKTFNKKSVLGAALLGQKKYADAEPLLLAGYEGLKQQEAKIPKDAKLRLVNSLERLVQLYEGWEKMEQAAEWRKKLESQRQAYKTIESGTKP